MKIEGAGEAAEVSVWTAAAPVALADVSDCAAAGPFALAALSA